MLQRLLWSVLGAAAAVLAVACGGVGAGAGDSSGPQTREVLVDYVHDEVASSFLLYFPRNVTVRPGDTVLFRQEWTGEPHSVTMGTLVDEMMDVVGPLIEKYGDSPEEPPRRVLRTFDKAMAPLPWMLLDDEGEDGALLVAQNAAQPCYLDTGGPPKDANTPCADAEQQQPPFNGRQSYYNSGYIPYDGEQGNEFAVELADDIEPGVYNYYCNLHGPFQAGTITVAEPGATIPSQEDVSRQALAEIGESADPLVAAYEAAPRDGEAQVQGMTVSPPLAGWTIEDPSAQHISLNEFIPSEITVDAGEAVEWSFVGGHTVSFQVPPYFAQIVVEDDGTVVFSPDATVPVNSPAPELEGGEGPSAEPPLVDAGAWDGEEFKSSGMMWDGARYRMTFERPGTYPYACLIHPQMVGSVEVR